jgi:hypothetical protein
MLGGLRTFRLDALPAETPITLAGLPGRMIETPARAAPSGTPLTLRAICLFAPARSFLLVAAAPRADWAALLPELNQVLEGFQPTRD